MLSFGVDAMVGVIGSPGGSRHLQRRRRLVVRRRWIGCKAQHTSHLMEPPNSVPQPPESGPFPAGLAGAAPHPDLWRSGPEPLIPGAGDPVGASGGPPPGRGHRHPELGGSPAAGAREVPAGLRGVGQPPHRFGQDDLEGHRPRPVAAAGGARRAPGPLQAGDASGWGSSHGVGPPRPPAATTSRCTRATRRCWPGVWRGSSGPRRRSCTRWRDRYRSRWRVRRRRGRHDVCRSEAVAEPNDLADGQHGGWARGPQRGGECDSAPGGSPNPATAMYSRRRPTASTTDRARPSSSGGGGPPLTSGRQLPPPEPRSGSVALTMATIAFLAGTGSRRRTVPISARSGSSARADPIPGVELRRESLACWGLPS